jgi:hypothetical protein
MHFIFAEFGLAIPDAPWGLSFLVETMLVGSQLVFFANFSGPEERRYRVDGCRSGVAVFLFLVALTRTPSEKIGSLTAHRRRASTSRTAPSGLPVFDYSKTHSNLLERSKFILCPRGFGASCIGIFEAMSFGRVPVIIRDACSIAFPLAGKVL